MATNHIPGNLKSVPFSIVAPPLSLRLFIPVRHFPLHKVNDRPRNMSTTATVTQAEPITAQSILRLFPDIDRSSAELDGHDEEQIRLMDEVCIVLDENDKPVGNLSKKICKFLSVSAVSGLLADNRRSSHDQHQQRAAAPRLLGLPLQLQE